MSDKEKTELPNEEEINFVENDSFHNTLKKTRRRQLLKYSIIGVITTAVVLFLLYLGGSFMLQSRINDYDSDFYDRIKGANIENNGTSYFYPAFSAVAYTSYIKMIGDRPLVWETKVKEYPMFGPSTLTSTGGGTGVFSEEEDRTIMYNNENGERVMDFYHPQVNYKILPNNLELVDEIRNTNTLAEFALSFDKSYKLDEINELIGLENVNWLWVDSYSDEDLKELEEDFKVIGHEITHSGDSVYGINVSTANLIKEIPAEELITQRGEEFVSHVTNLKDSGDYKLPAKELFDVLKGEDNNLTIEDLHIIGVVVTGDADELSRFQNLDFVRASTLGATTPKY